MKSKITLILVLFSLFFTAAAFADTSIRAEVDKTKITTADTLTYKLIIITSEKNTPVPEAPKFSGFSVVSQAQSSTISFVKGATDTHLAYVFILMPLQTGKLKIEPSNIKVGPKTYASGGFEIEVTQSKSTPKTPEQKNLTAPDSQPDSEEPQTTL